MMGPGWQMPAFSDFDRDHDGSLTRDEFYDARADRMRERAQQGYPMRGAATAPSFESVDTDGDGAITPSELNAGQAGHHQQMFQPR